jgi:hypothetical protein
MPELEISWVSEEREELEEEECRKKLELDRERGARGVGRENQRNVRRMHGGQQMTVSEAIQRGGGGARLAIALYVIYSSLDHIFSPNTSRVKVEQLWHPWPGVGGGFINYRYLVSLITFISCYQY